MAAANSSTIGVVTSGGAKAAETYPLMSRREVEGLIAEGRTIVIVDRHVLRVDAWLKYHPGGDKAIMHVVGRDATDEARGFVLPPSIPPPTYHGVQPLTDMTSALLGSTPPRRWHQ
jgi:cytochrome b involved in lipid metabolism